MSFLSKIIQEKYHIFSKTDYYLVDFFLENESNIAFMTIAEISLQTEISQTTIFNFVKKLGFDGFQEFKIALASSYSQNQEGQNLPISGKIKNDDSIERITNKVIAFNKNSLDFLAKSINENEVERIIDIIDQSKVLHFFGQGGSSVIALDSYQKFLRSKFRCNYIPDYHMQLMNISKLNNEDCVMLFSHSGESRETINLAREARNQGAKIISLTGNPNSKLRIFSDETIFIFSEEAHFHSESLASRIAYLTFMDILYAIVMYKYENSNLLTIKKIRKGLDHSKK